MKHFIYHHKDLDGLTCGALALRYSGEFDNYDQAPINLIGYHYGEEFDMRKFTKQDVEMADVSLEMERMFQLAKTAKSLTWYDHHLSAFEQWMKYVEDNKLEYTTTDFGLVKRHSIASLNFHYYYSEKIAGCENYLTVMARPESENFKSAIRALGQYDTWRNTPDRKLTFDHPWDELVMPFQYGMRNASTPKEVLDTLDYTEFNAIINIGKALLKYQKNVNAVAMKKSFEFTLNGLNIVACNGVQPNSMSFEGFYFDDHHDAMMPFTYDGRKNVWECSLYTTKDVDILAIAKAFGGGGHLRACGFQLPAVNANIIPNFIQEQFTILTQPKNQDDGNKQQPESGQQGAAATGSDAKE